MALYHILPHKPELDQPLVMDQSIKLGQTCETLDKQNAIRATLEGLVTWLRYAAAQAPRT